MRTYGQFCAVARALDRVGDRWTLLIVRELLVGPRRFTDLRANLPGLATNLLAERLRRLVDDGLAVRRELPPPAPATVYELSDAGRELEPIVLGLIRFGARYMDGPAPTDVFRPEWLGLAICALLDGRPANDLRAELRTGEMTLALGPAEDGGVRVEPGERPDADVAVEADPQTLLGIFAGALSLSAAARVRGDRRALERLLAPAA